MEKNLLWLQNFCYKLDLNSKSHVIEDITDHDIINDPYGNKEREKYQSNLLNLEDLNNPGWSLKLNLNNTIYQNIKFNNFAIHDQAFQSEQDWFAIRLTTIQQYNNIVSLSSSLPSLSIILEVLKNEIEGISYNILDLLQNRENIQKENPLITWFEDFYLSCCDLTDPEDCYCGIAVRLLFTKSGWVMVVYFHDHIDYEDKAFERMVVGEDQGKVECYKIKKQFIIRAHTRGLITGIQIFKDWIEKSS